VDAWWGIVNWAQVSLNYENAARGQVERLVEA
jgi:hypothetical protein